MSDITYCTFYSCPNKSCGRHIMVSFENGGGQFVYVADYKECITWQRFDRQPLLKKKKYPKTLLKPILMDRVGDNNG